MEWLFLLLPIAALSGWLSARRHYKKRYKQANTFEPDYFRGLNYLLNEQPDKAIDVFIRLLEVNSETVETHLALANLFRRRGETDRAIRIHQNLITRSNLSASQRNQALVELGLDYMSAGVLDRAEQLFLELLGNSSPQEVASQQLLNIYQKEKKWSQAIEIAKNIQSQTQQNMGATIAQFYCEMAEQSLITKSEDVAVLLKQAHLYDANCIRATLLDAQRHIEAKKFRKALKKLKKIEIQDPKYLPEALPKLELCYRKLNELPAFKEYLTELMTHFPQMTSIRIMLTTVIEDIQGEQAAQDFLYQQLNEHPSIEGLHTLLSLGELSPDIISPLISKITNKLPLYTQRYSCQHCGFSGKTMHWHCPSCKQWGTIRPTEIHLPALENQVET